MHFIVFLLTSSRFSFLIYIWEEKSVHLVTQNGTVMSIASFALRYFFFFFFKNVLFFLAFFVCLFVGTKILVWLTVQGFTSTREHWTFKTGLQEYKQEGRHISPPFLPLDLLSHSCYVFPAYCELCLFKHFCPKLN